MFWSQWLTKTKKAPRCWSLFKVLLSAHHVDKSNINCGNQDSSMNISKMEIQHGNLEEEQISDTSGSWGGNICLLPFPAFFPFLYSPFFFLLLPLPSPSSPFFLSVHPSFLPILVAFPPPANFLHLFRQERNRNGCRMLHTYGMPVLQQQKTEKSVL